VNLTNGVLALRPVVTHCMKRMWVIYYFVGLLSLDHSDDSEWVEESKEVNVVVELVWGSVRFH